jgi:CheY-like chemotaxis protein
MQVRPADEGTRPTIALLVDDEADSRKANQARLEGEGYSVMVAQTEAEALNRARQAAPRVIYMHLMAGPGNMRLIQALRADDSCRHIPVVVIRDKPTATKVVPSKLRSVPREG